MGSRRATTTLALAVLERPLWDTHPPGSGSMLAPRQCPANLTGMWEADWRLRTLATVSWRPPTTDSLPRHRVDHYAFRAGELRRPDGTTTGYALVLTTAVWTQIGGRLWWRRWSDPYVETEVWISADGVQAAYADGWVSGDVMDEHLDLWGSGQMAVGHEARHAVRWLDAQTSARVAREVFDVDLDALRAERTGRVP